jgi:hypothetical protein
VKIRQPAIRQIHALRLFKTLNFRTPIHPRPFATPLLAPTGAPPLRLTSAARAPHAPVQRHARCTRTRQEGQWVSLWLPRRTRGVVGVANSLCRQQLMSPTAYVANSLCRQQLMKKLHPLRKLEVMRRARFFCCGEQGGRGKRGLIQASAEATPCLPCFSNMCLRPSPWGMR